MPFGGLRASTHEVLLGLIPTINLRLRSRSKHAFRVTLFALLFTASDHNTTITFRTPALEPARLEDEDDNNFADRLTLPTTQPTRLTDRTTSVVANKSSQPPEKKRQAATLSIHNVGRALKHGLRLSAKTRTQRWPARGVAAGAKARAEHAAVPVWRVCVGPAVQRVSFGRGPRRKPRKLTDAPLLRVPAPPQQFLSMSLRGLGGWLRRWRAPTRQTRGNQHNSDAKQIMHRGSHRTARVPLGLVKRTVRRQR